jgi:LPXTG-site transpeptidase (sortase) family protein
MNKKNLIPVLFLVSLGLSTTTVFAETSPSVLYVPLIGITSVPQPLALPLGAGNVTYHYAVKNFLKEAALRSVQVSDNKCSPVKFVEGDDNNNGELDHNETWRYSCTTKLSTTTESTATAMGTANDITATHKAYATVVVGSKNPAPLVSIINITKVAYPLSLPIEGGKITFTYKVNNPGAVPLEKVTVVDDKCSVMSGKLGDTNGNNLLDTNEVWIYTCTAILKQTTTNTVHVSAFANGLKAVGDATLTVKVDIPLAQSSPQLPDAGATPDLKITVWKILSGVLLALIMVFVLTRKRMLGKIKKKLKFFQLLFIVMVCLGVVGIGLYFFLGSAPYQSKPVVTPTDQLFGWKFPVTRFPLTGSSPGLLAYSDIRDPGGIPQGLPVRLKIPVIGVDSAIEDALITSDGRMDVPAGSKNVAWFALGPPPGEEGSAVIGGHFGINNGVPFVFYDLDKLKEGDKIYIIDDKGDTLPFVVRSIKLFDRNADATTVFTSADGLAHLNLITCEGLWNKVNDTYPERRVVFTDAVAGGGALAPATAAFHRSLAIGATGADVATLQTLLEQKGFLVMPSGVTKGYFGLKTQIAIAKYQASVGLPPVGVFGALTRAKLIGELGDTPSIPDMGREEIPTSDRGEKVANNDSQTFLQTVKSLFGTPVDTSVSILLLLSIAFVAFKIIWR